jgi:hypothetical protein
MNNMNEITCKCGNLIELNINTAKAGYYTWKLENTFEKSPAYIWLCIDCGQEFFLERKCPVYSLKEDKEVGIALL